MSRHTHLPSTVTSFMCHVTLIFHMTCLHNHLLTHWLFGRIVLRQSCWGTHLGAWQPPVPYVTCMQTHVHVCKLMYMYANSCTCMQTHVHVCKLMYMYANSCTCMQTPVHVCKLMYMYANSIRDMMTSLYVTCLVHVWHDLSSIWHIGHVTHDLSSIWHIGWLNRWMSDMTRATWQMDEWHDSCDIIDAPNTCDSIDAPHTCDSTQHLWYHATHVISPNTRHIIQSRNIVYERQGKRMRACHASAMVCDMTLSVYVADTWLCMCVWHTIQQRHTIQRRKVCVEVCVEVLSSVSPPHLLSHLQVPPSPCLSSVSFVSSVSAPGLGGWGTYPHCRYPFFTFSVFNPFFGSLCTK